MARDELLQIIQLTKDFIRQEHPQKVTNTSKIAAALSKPLTEKRETLVMPKPISQNIIEKPSEKPKEIHSESAPAKFTPDPLTDIKNLVRKLFPSFNVIEEIPSDEIAHKKKRESAELIIKDIVILSFNEPASHVQFLENIAKALSHHGYPTSLIFAAKIEAKMQWQEFLNSSDLKFIIASPHSLYATPKLMQHYRETTQAGKVFLGNQPLFQLNDLKEYLKDPALKAHLWMALLKFLGK